MKRILILGGTQEATLLAAALSQQPDWTVITSLAGRTQSPAAHPTRLGGFGGVPGLVDYLQTQRIDLLVDATHPFADQISWNAAAAAAITAIPHLILSRPAWQPQAGDHWIEVANHAQAATLLPELGQRIFLTIGRQELGCYAHLPTWMLMRMVEPPGIEIPNGRVLLERGPFSFSQEYNLLQQYQIAAMVSKNSGGTATYAKLEAARAAHIPVVMVQRPTPPNGETVETPAAALSWISTYW